ncbi:S9 family peptidase [Corynebacterium anserum]|uniref:Prolyl oligopeptidase family serine peptidase n=1 Tax=Corynebacterium anserum TaxID=2684406 RepID=A0A7G7YM61_9CORY|nr:S9 family peptidase [Corynebacterium anserum]QNH95581.1 prolyl oligopeptidase family serine peptidase [Corynebacterium anserum]
MNPVVSTTTTPAPPVARKVPFTRTFHGIDFHDDYEWLREKDNPEVRAYLEAENAYTSARTAHLRSVENAIFREVKARVQETDMSLPVRVGGYWYYARTQEGKSYSQSCRLPLEDSHSWEPPVIDPQVPHDNEHVFLDSNVEAEGHDFFALGAASVTLDGTRLAYSTDTTGNERFTLRFRNVETGEDFDDVIENVSYGATWVGNDTVYYQRVDEAWRPHEVWKHVLGTPVEQDQLVFREDDGRFWTGVGTTRSERYLLIFSGSKVTSEVWYLDVENPSSELTCVLPREAGVEYGVDHAQVDGKDYWMVVHNKFGVNSEVGYCPVGQISSLEEITSLVPHRDDVRVEGVEIFSDHILLEQRENAVESLYIMKLVPGEGFGDFQPITFDEELVGVTAAGNNEWDTPILRVAVSSFSHPAQVFDIDLRTDQRHLRKEQIVLPAPDGTPFRAEDYTASRLWVTARDGARIPVSLIHRTDVPLDRENPVLLYGYGSYEASMDPGFSIFRLSMLDRGVVYAIAHVRGGGEMGRIWYDNGKGMSKMNTFTDFVDVADHLIKTGMTSPQKMVAEGGSAGGLLMGAVANLAGDRFAGIEAVVPFVDPLTSILKPELPLTVTEWDEWGDPYHDPEVYRYMAAYAPYENITADKTYPPILAITSLNDTRVLYVEPAKWVAKLRDVAGADVLLKTEMEAGHGGVSGRYEKWKQSAFETAWELDRMGATELIR